MGNILVIGGLHGDEPLGIEMVRGLQEKPLPGVTAIIGNPEAVRANIRCIESDLNRVFPGKSEGNLEERRAAEIIEIAQGFDLVLDFHNTRAPDNDCTFVGEEPSQEMLAAIGALGLERIVVCDCDCVNRHIRGSIGIEISISSALCNASEWRKRIAVFAEGITLERKAPTLFRLVRRVNREERERYDLKDWRAFAEIPDRDREALGLPTGTYCAIFVNDAYTAQNYATLLTPIKK